MRYLFLIFLLLIYFTSFSQKTIDSSEFSNQCTPWGGFILDIGLNQYKDNPNNIDLNAWKSKGVNIYYYHGFSIACSKFSIAPGIGLGLDSYSFENESLRLSTSNDSLKMNSAPPLAGVHYKKSKLAANYIDIPLELRFEAGKHPGKIFRMAVGAKAGILFDSHTKEKFETDDKENKTKLKDKFALNTFRYGLIARIGFSYLNLFGYYSLSDLFDTDLGPKATPWMVGITLSPSFHFRK